MGGPSGVVNRYTIAFQLNEALEAIRSTIGDPAVNPALWVSLVEILGHLCLAWHRRESGPDALASESQEEYELRADSVPNWGGRFRLVEFAASHPAIDAFTSRGSVNRDTVNHYLQAAHVELQALLDNVMNGRFDRHDATCLAEGFVPILRNLCLAWHLRSLSQSEINTLQPSAIEDLSWQLPRWQWNLRLVPSREEAGKNGG
jgi:hypothetical protein